MAPSFQMPPEVWDKVQALPGNDSCIECGKKGPEWASVSHGTIFCLECSGRHRGLGTHISFVRSVKMDSWSDTQLEIMKLGGNKKLQDYLVKHGIDTKASTREKYDNDVAQLYKLQLKARAEGKPVPMKLPPPKSKDAGESKYQGFGSTPPPPPRQSAASKLVYVAVPVVVAAGVWVFSRS